jgi:hypothetical protein
MLSPKKITQVGLCIGVISLVGLIPTFFLASSLGFLKWWPAWGLGVALLLLVGAYARGAYLTAQRRVDMVDMLNDCYQGVNQEETIR